MPAPDVERGAALAVKPLPDGHLQLVLGQLSVVGAMPMTGEHPQERRLHRVPATKLETACSNVAAWSAHSSTGAAATTTALESGPATRQAISR